LEAIEDYQISGLKTTLDFGKYVLKHEAFTSGDFDTNFVKKYFSDPKIMYTSMQEEEKAWKYAIQEIWDGIKERDGQEFASREITSGWRSSRS